MIKIKSLFTPEKPVQNNNSNYGSCAVSNVGFTIVELIVVIVIIGILAAITIVSYIGITAKANQATLISDIANGKKKLSLYYTENGSYPTAMDASMCPTAPKADNNYCLEISNGNNFNYYGNAKNFTLTADNGAIASTVSNDSSVANLSLANQQIVQLALLKCQVALLTAQPVFVL